MVLPVTSEPAAAGRGGEALAPGGRRLLQRDPGAGPGAARAAGRCESGRGGAGTRRFHRGRTAPRRSLRSLQRKPRAGGRWNPGAGGGDPGTARGPDLPHCFPVSVEIPLTTPQPKSVAHAPEPAHPHPSPRTHLRQSWSLPNPLTPANSVTPAEPPFLGMPLNASRALWSSDPAYAPFSLHHAQMQKNKNKKQNLPRFP